MTDNLYRLGDEVFAPQRQPLRVTKVDVAPLVTFTFKYRSLGVLRSAVRDVDNILNVPAALQIC